MEETRVLYRLVPMLICFMCLGFSVGMCSDSDVLIKSYISSSKDLVDSAKLQVPSITESDWNSQVLEPEVPVVVFFTADWCGVCGLENHVVNRVEPEFTGRAKFYSVDIDEEATIPARYHIRSLPTIIIFKGGNAVATHTGVITGSTLHALVERYL